MGLATRKARLGIFVGVKGRGSNMSAIADACTAGHIPAEVAVVIGQVSGSPALEKARSMGLKTEVVSSKEAQYGPLLIKKLQEASVDLVCLAGYMRILPSEVVDEYQGRTLNIHPALLPKFGGQGMYGSHVHQAVLDAGESESGCTVHVVNNVYDEGEIVLQRTCPVLPNDTVESLSSRVLAEEHLAYPAAIELVWNRINTYQA